MITHRRMKASVTDDDASTNVCYHNMIRIEGISLGVTKSDNDASSCECR